MSRFVEDCRKEWHRLGVPEAVANEMASDLEADLAEAESDGASPEEVLGNGVFDARSFAASWANARGVVPAPTGTGRGRRVHWALAAAAVFFFALVLAGVLASLVGHDQGSVAIGIVHKAGRPFTLHRAFKTGPGVFVPRVFGPIVVQKATNHVVGSVIFLVGLVGLVVALVLLRPWTMRRRRSQHDEEVGLHSYL